MHAVPSVVILWPIPSKLGRVLFFINSVPILLLTVIPINNAWTAQSLCLYFLIDETRMIIVPVNEIVMKINYVNI